MILKTAFFLHIRPDYLTMFDVEVWQNLKLSFFQLFVFLFLFTKLLMALDIPINLPPEIGFCVCKLLADYFSCCFSRLRGKTRSVLRSPEPMESKPTISLSYRENSAPKYWTQTRTTIHSDKSIVHFLCVLFGRLKIYEYIFVCGDKIAFAQ